MHEVMRELADWAVCGGKDCGMPNIIWQPWRKLFRCGWCGRDYTLAKVKKLEKQSELAHQEIVHRRNSAIAQVSRPRRMRVIAEELTPTQ